MSGQRLAITGGTGFVGRHLIAECAGRGNFRLRVLRHRSPLPFCEESVEWCDGDLLSPETLRDFLVRGCTLVHLAYARDAEQSNLIAARNLIDAANRVGIRRFVHCSTAVVIGFGSSGIVDEDTPAYPENEYQRTKRLIERRLFEDLSPSIELAILRPTEIIGAGGQGLQRMITRIRKGGVVNRLYRIVLKNRRLNYIPVQNVVAALLLLSSTNRMRKRDLYILSDDDDPDNDFASVECIIRRALGKSGKFRLDVGLPLSMLPILFRCLGGHSTPNRVYSHARISALGYRPVVSLRGAIEALVKECYTAGWQGQRGCESLT